jgi:energy-coupling factor transport system substrate-specific component
LSWQLASFMLLGLALIGCFAWYEHSRPSSRTVALVATLAALATLGRIAFAPLPDVKPTTDIVLIAGYALGAAPGFAVGAITALASNLFFGQGPWTPWQMLAWGLCGLAGAALALPGWRIPRVVLACICAVAGFGYGFVLDFYTWVGYSGEHTLAQYLFIEGEAFPFNLTQAIGNFVFCLAFGPALVRALQRFRLRLDVRFVGLVLLVLLAVSDDVGVGGGGAVARAATPSRALRAEIGYLRRAQNPDGGWGSAAGQQSSQLFTAWAVIGLAGAGVDPRDLARDGHTPVAWIEDHVGQLRGAGDLERTILALRAAGATVGEQVGELERDQSRDGSFSGQSNLTAFAILALRAAGTGRVGAADAWLVRQQNTDGGFSFAQRGSESDVDDTAGAVEALVAAGAPKRVIARAVGYLERARNRDGGFPEEPGGSSNAESTAWAVQAVIAAGATPAGDAYLERLTTSSGAVDYAAGQSQTPVWVTAQALAALSGHALPLN